MGYGVAAVSETGAVYAVDVVYAGANLMGDHLSGSEYLSVLYGWDFAEGGGQLEVADQTLTYTSATFPSGEDDDEPTILTLDGLLPAAVEDGEFVKVLPESVEKVAWVEARGFGEPIRARVEHALIALLPEGIRGGADEAETVTLTQDSLDSWVVTGVVGLEPSIDGGAITPGTLPPSPPPAPETPTISNPPTVSPLGIGGLMIAVQPIENPTSVMYDYYLSDSMPVPIDPAHLLTSSASSMAATDVLPDGTPLVAGTVYYAAVQTRSADQLGPVSAEDSGTPVQATADNIAANAVIAEHLSAGSVTSDKIASLVIISGSFLTAEAGARDGITATEGHVSYGPDGRLMFQTQNGNVFASGVFRATQLEVTNGGTVRGEVAGAPMSSFLMGDKIGPPGTAPTAEDFYDTITLDGGGVAGDDESKRHGLAWHDGHWWVASRNATTAMLLKFDPAGAFVSSASRPGTNAYQPTSLTIHGGTFYMFAPIFGLGSALTFNSDGSYPGPSGGVVVLADTTGPMRDTGVLGSDGTNLLLAWRSDPAADLKWQAYGTTGVQVGAEIVVPSMSAVPRAVVGGTFDLAGARVVVPGADGVAHVLGVAGGTGHESSANFWTDGADRGFCWDGGRFAALHDPTTIRLHTGEGKEIGILIGRYLGATWFESAGTTHETVVSPRTLVFLRSRARYRFTASSPIPVGGGADDPNGVRFYAGILSALAKLELQGAAVGLSPGDFASIELDELILSPGDGTDDAVNPPPASGNFGVAIPYELVSERVDADGDPLVKLTGAGYAGGQGLRPVGEITMWAGPTSNIPAGWLVCDGAAVSRITYAKLWGIIGVQFGAGNGTSTFNIPDFRSRFPVGAGTYTPLGDDENQPTESMRNPAHSHSAGSLTTGPSNDNVRRLFQDGANNTAKDTHSHNVTGRTANSMGPGADAGDNAFPRLGVHFIIRAT